MCSSGIRLGAWDYLRWGHIIPVRRENVIVAVKIRVYAEDDEEYFSFITPEAYNFYRYGRWAIRKIDKNKDRTSELVVQ
ncbi:MAG: hypothetical protein WBZ36_24185 [Candidatus Nitrosopolaris sp.]|jgi:hypothetical protein